jgi:hypothetical protein
MASRTFLKAGMIVVKKPGGTEFIGEVVNIYALPNGTERMDVRCIAPGARDMIHIYRPDQFRPATGFEMHRIELMAEIWTHGHAALSQVAGQE